jgi:hypothetical protein
MPWPDHCPSAQTSARVHRGSGRAGSIITFTMVPYSEGVYHNAHINQDAWPSGGDIEEL